MKLHAKIHHRALILDNYYVSSIYYLWIPNSPEETFKMTQKGVHPGDRYLHSDGVVRESVVRDEDGARSGEFRDLNRAVETLVEYELKLRGLTNGEK